MKMIFCHQIAMDRVLPERSLAFLLKAAGAFAALVIGLFSSSGVSAADFDCRVSQYETMSANYCDLGPEGAFEGITLGSSKKDAFEHLCKRSVTSSWSVKVGNSTNYTDRKVGLNCRDWPIFEKSSFWLLSISVLPCKGSGGIAISLKSDRVRKVLAVCPLT